MEELATSLLATLKRSSAPVETKLSLLNSLKSSIKHQRIPESAQPASIECIRIAISTQTSASLVTAGFATLGHLTKRLIIQDQTNALFSPRANLLPLLLERLGDAKEIHRASASQALCDLWPVRQVDVENLIKNDAISSSIPRLKEAGMDWVTKMHTSHQLQFRGFVPSMIECLEDAESTVRESAKGNIIALFTDARDAAKADLKRQLITYNVRRSIMSFILSQLQIPLPSEVVNASTQASHRQETVMHEQNVVETPATAFDSSTSCETGVDPLYVQSQRELEEVFRQMSLCFEDKESEDNWKARDTNTMKIRRLLKGNAFAEHHVVFLTSIKSLLEGILKVANSLRTTMSTNGCQLVQELAKTLGPALDPMVEIILQGFEKMSASTKHINAQNADATIDTIFSRVSCHIRLVQHIWHAVQDKNVQPRTLAAGWLKTLLKRHMQNKTQFDSGNGLDIADKSIRKGLVDANPKVREAMRGTYWVFARGWPDRGEAIMAMLDLKSRQLLQKDPGNANGVGVMASFTSSVGPTTAPNPRAAPSTSRSSLKETIAAQKKAAMMTAKKPPERPSSAMSSFSPVRQAPPSAVRPVAATSVSQSRAPPVDATLTTRPPLTTTTSSSGGLLSAPMRRPKRPEVTRPATADLYGNKRVGRGITPPRSPVVSPVRNDMKSPGVKSPTNNPETAGPKSFEKTSRFTSPKLSPARSMQQIMFNVNPSTISASTAQLETGSPSPRNEENLTMVIPRAETLETLAFPNSKFTYNNGPASKSRLSLPSTVEEDNFTMVVLENMPASLTAVPETTKVDYFGHALVTINGDSSKQMRAQKENIATIDFGSQSRNDVMPLPISQFERANEEDLILFEDPTAEDIVVLTSEEMPRSALEELHMNAQIPAPHVDLAELAQPEENHDGPLTTVRGKLMMEQPFEDRAETLKTRRLIKSGIDRIKARTLDIYGFRRLHELILKTSSSGELPTTELYKALVGYIRPSDDIVGHQSNRSLDSQALACMRAVMGHSMSQDEDANLHSDALLALVMAARGCEKHSLYAKELEKTADDIIRGSLEKRLPQLNHLLQQNWDQASVDVAAYRRIIPALLAILTKLTATLPAKGETLGYDTRTQLCNLAVRCLKDVDVEVRKAGTDFCLEIYGAFGRDNQAEYWKCIRGAGEGQMNLVAYYLAKKKLV